MRTALHVNKSTFWIIVLFSLFLFTKAHATDYLLPESFGTGIFSSCALTEEPNTYHCTESIDFDNDNSVNLLLSSSNVQMYIEGDFIVKNNFTSSIGAYELTIVATDNISIQNNVDFEGNLVSYGDLTIGNNADFEGNIVAYGDVDIGTNGEIDGSVFTGDDLDIGNNTTISGISGYTPLSEWQMDECQWQGNVDEVQDALRQNHGRSYGLNSDGRVATTVEEGAINRAGEFLGEGYNADPNNAWYSARYFVRVSSDDTLSPLAFNDREMSIAGWFRLVELIFTIVIIGILAAVAVPKFGDLKQNAELSNVNSAITALVRSGKAAYMNEVELNGVSDVNITDILEVNGKGWGDDGEDMAWYASSDINISFEYDDTNSRIAIVAQDNVQSDAVVSKIQKQTGLDFNETITPTGGTEGAGTYINLK